jgi:hypothetical protein
MSGASAKREIGTGEKPATSHGKAPSGESANKVKGSPSHNKSRRSGDKKKMKKVVYYETDCHTRFQKANRMRTMYVPGSEFTYTAIT